MTDPAAMLDHALLLSRSEPRAPQAGQAPARLEAAARDFEALLLQTFLRAASRPVLEDAPLAPSRTEQLYREMFFEEIAQRAAQRGGIGLTETLLQAERAAEEGGS